MLSSHINKQELIRIHHGIKVALGWQPDVACIRWYSTVGTETNASGAVYQVTSNLDVNASPILIFSINSSYI